MRNFIVFVLTMAAIFGCYSMAVADPSALFQELKVSPFRELASSLAPGEVLLPVDATSFIAGKVQSNGEIMITKILRLGELQDLNGNSMSPEKAAAWEGGLIISFKVKNFDNVKLYVLTLNESFRYPVPLTVQIIRIVGENNPMDEKYFFYDPNSKFFDDAKNIQYLGTINNLFYEWSGMSGGPCYIEQGKLVKR